MLLHALYQGIVYARDLYRGWRLIRQLPAHKISLFGSSNSKEDDHWSIVARTIAMSCASRSIGVITGGGPGVMIAANCGALEGASTDRLSSIGIGVKGVDEAFINRCAPVVNVTTFCVRKHLLLAYSQAFIFMPGGIGTLDELFELANLRKHHLLHSAPIILVGRSYWAPLLAWYTSAIEHDYVSRSYAHLFHVVDTSHEVMELIASGLKHQGM